MWRKEGQASASQSTMREPAAHTHRWMLSERRRNQSCTASSGHDQVAAGAGTGDGTAMGLTTLEIQGAALGLAGAEVQVGLDLRPAGLIALAQQVLAGLGALGMRRPPPQVGEPVLVHPDRPRWAGVHLVADCH